MFIRTNPLDVLPCWGRSLFYRLLKTSVEFLYSFGTFCISFEFYTESEYLNNIFRTLGSAKHLYDQCQTYALRSNNVKFNQTFIQPTPNVPETFFVSWVIGSRKTIEILLRLNLNSAYFHQIFHRKCRICG